MQARNHRLEEARRVGIAAGAGALLGVFFGHTAWFIAGALAVYLAWVLAELIKLHRWLSGSDGEEPPESFGLWGEILDDIYRLQKRERAARAELQSTLDRARASVVALRDAVVIFDTSGALEWWNPAAEALLGLAWGKDQGQPITNLLRDPRFRRYLEARDFAQVLEFSSPRSDDVYLQVQVTVFGNGDHLMIARDVTRLYQVEQMRRDFVANVSHELKTPLTVIKGYLENFTSVDAAAPPKYQRAFRQMAQQAERMDRLVNDLLLLSRLESTQPDPAQNAVPLKTLLENIRQDVATTRQDKQHVISLRMDDPDLRLLGSDVELQSAFSNIVVNAAKYTDPNGEIDIHAWSDMRGVHVAVRDSGIGIEAQHIPRLTERFYRTDKGRSLAEGGTGLGLAIVKHVLKRHDGMLEIHSEPGKGSTFTCHFPRGRVAGRG